ncbi:helix-turn-helix domain-containing protein [Micromonospora sp. CA-111912]|uniref:helix-turn-helix domain-containing protein n=1 Tax=Micromonospora sp. CA-111912 TaxID=3239955 RepID=UPI003D8DB968
MTVVPAGGVEPSGEELRRFARRFLRGRRLQLIIDGSEPVDVPPVVGEALAEVVSILGRGRPVRVMQENVEISTGEAAAILGVTRPTVVKLMNDGALPYTRPNSSRRVALHDVLTYKEQRSRARREALDELTGDAIDMGVYDEAMRRGREPSDDQPGRDGGR